MHVLFLTVLYTIYYGNLRNVNFINVIRACTCVDNSSYCITIIILLLP